MEKRIEVFRFFAQTILLVIIIGILVFKFKPPEEASVIYLRSNFENKAYIDFVKFYKEKYEIGQNVDFDIKWHFREPLPESSIISYHIIDSKGNSVVNVDLSQNTNGEKFTYKGEGGKLIFDKISLVIPRTLQKGIYEVTAYIYPHDKWKIKPEHENSIMGSHALLFNIVVE